MTAPSIKGVALRSLVEDAKHQVEAGTTSPGDLALLGEAERTMLDDGVLDSMWYPLTSYERLTKFVQRTLGRGDPNYVRNRGVALAERLIALGLYQQVDFVTRAGKAESMDQAVSTLRLVASMWGGFFNVGQWTVHRDDATGKYGLVVRDAAALPDLVCEALLGVIGRLAQETGASSDVRMERPTRDVVQYTLQLDPS
jgi:hypothetical protein